MVSVKGCLLLVLFLSFSLLAVLKLITSFPGTSIDACGGCIFCAIADLTPSDELLIRAAPLVTQVAIGTKEMMAPRICVEEFIAR